MKRMTTIIAVLLTVFSTATFAGNSNGKSEVAVIDYQVNDKYRLIYQGETLNKVRVQLIDNDGEVLVSKNYKQLDGFHVIVDFKNLPSGEYTFLIDNGVEVLTNKVTHTPVS
ncbi:MAG: hypothetical protein RJQ09_07395 [Cyclobacteriaceae bacterium]